MGRRAAVRRPQGHLPAPHRAHEAARGAAARVQGDGARDGRRRPRHARRARASSTACARSSASATRTTRRSSASCPPRSASCSIPRTRAPSSSGSRAQQYRKDLERIVVEAARQGAAPAPATLAALRSERGVDEAEEAARARATILAPGGPIAAIYERRARRDRRGSSRPPRPRTDGRGDDAERASRRASSLLRHLAQRRAHEHAIARARRARRDDEAAPRSSRSAQHAKARGIVRHWPARRCSTASTQRCACRSSSSSRASRAATAPRSRAEPLLAIAQRCVAPPARGRSRCCCRASRTTPRATHAARDARRSRADRPRGRGPRDGREEPADPRAAHEGARRSGSDASASAAVRAVSGTTSGELPAVDPAVLRADARRASASPASTRRSMRTRRWRR